MFRGKYQASGKDLEEPLAGAPKRITGWKGGVTYEPAMAETTKTNQDYIKDVCFACKNGNESVHDGRWWELALSKQWDAWATKKWGKLYRHGSICLIFVCFCFKLVKSSVERWCDQCVFHRGWDMLRPSTTFLSLGLLISWGNSCPSDCWPWCDLTANTWWWHLLDLSRHYMVLGNPRTRMIGPMCIFRLTPPPRSNWWVTQTTPTISTISD